MKKKYTDVLIKNAKYVCTMDRKRRILKNASIYIQGNEIVEIDSKERKAERVIDASGMIVVPGFINTHHHMFQSLFRNVPYQQNQRIDRWIEAMSTMARELTKEASYYSALTNMIELLLSGCTTSVDFFYIFPYNNNKLLDETIKAAKDVGMRFHPIRGNMSLGKSKGGGFLDDVVQSLEEILRDSKRVIREYHDSKKFSMLRVGVGPCTPFTSEKEVFEKIRDLARKNGVQLHTHISESEWEVNEYCLKNFGMRPVEYMKSIDWVGRDVVFVHCIYLNDEEIKIISETNTGVSHCPISNARGETIAPITEMLNNRVNVSVGVDGSAANDSSNILEEMRWVRILQGARKGFTYLKPSQVLEIGTIGGALVLNRDDIGSLEVGKCADIAIFDTRNSIAFAGAVHDPIGSLIANQAIDAKYVLVNGQIIVENGKVTTVDTERIIEKQNNLAKEIVSNAEEKTGIPLTKTEWIRVF